MSLLTAESDPLILELVAALNARRLTEVPATVKVAWGYDSIRDDPRVADAVGFAAYDPDTRTIWLAEVPATLAGDFTPAEWFASNLAHEYFHHWQHVTGRRPSERQANRFTAKFMKSRVARKAR